MNPLRVTFLRQRVRPRRPRRRLFAPEWLEPRHLPAAGLAGIVATQPADGSTWIGAPHAFTITFDQTDVNAIDATFASFFGVPSDQALSAIVADDFNQDVEIDQIQSDRTVVPFAGGFAAAPVLETVTTSTATDGTTQTQLVVTLPPGTPDMTPGNYQLDVLPASMLGAAFGFVEPNSAWATSFNPIPVAQFTVLGQGPTLAGASQLGPVGAEGLNVWGTLDPADYQSAVSFYQFTVPQGGLWQINATVLSHAIGSPLLSALTLFDSNGAVLATSDTGSGTAADPLDPVMTTGLGPGTYYLGVSASLNLPGSPQGYNAVTGRPGTIGEDVPAGNYDLEVSATPVLSPTKLVSANLDYADPLETSPTGLDLTFSGPIDTSWLTPGDVQETTLSVVDASGRTWPVTAVEYDASQDTLSFIFDEALPAGTYSLVTPLQGGLTDPAGRPVGGLPDNAPGVLATFNVAAPTGPSDPNDLGVVWPGPTNSTWYSEMSQTLSLGTGQEVNDTFTVICPGVYELETNIATGSVNALIFTGGGVPVLEADGLTQLSRSLVTLGPGVYEMQIAAAGPAPATLQWLLRPMQIDYEKIVENGVGQSPALTFGLIASTTANPGSPSTAGPAGSWSMDVSGASPSASSSTTDTTVEGSTADMASPGAATDAPAPAPSVIPSSLLVSLDSGLAGLPSPDQWYTSSAGPTTEATVLMVAATGPGQQPGFPYATSTSGTDPDVGEGESVTGPVTAPPVVASRDIAPRPSGAAFAAASARADAITLALAQADPLVRIADWIARPSSNSGEPEVPAAEPASTLLASIATPDGFAPMGDTDGAGPARDRRRTTLAQADLGVPFALLVGTALTYQLSQPIRKWWRRHHTAHPTLPRPYGLARAGRSS